METRSSRNIRTILVEPFKQIKLGLYVISITIAFVCVTAFLFVSAFTEQYQHVVEIFKVVNPKFQWELATNDIYYSNISKLLSVLLVFIVVLFAVLFRLTHKYYGPLVSVQRFISEISRGNYGSRIVIRKGDELKELVKSLNAMAQDLQDRHGARVGDLTDRRAPSRDENSEP